MVELNSTQVCITKLTLVSVPGHVGDSGIVLGEQDPECPDVWVPRPLTRDHKPECEIELARIEAAGGKVVNKSGVPRVVWNRPRIGKLQNIFA